MSFGTKHPPLRRVRGSWGSKARDLGAVAAVSRCQAMPGAAQLFAVERSPSATRRARFWAAANKLKSALTLRLPRTRALLPPWRRLTRWASFRSTLGRVAR